MESPMMDPSVIEAEGTDTLPTLDKVIEDAQDTGANLASTLSFLYGEPISHEFIADVRDKIEKAQRELAECDSKLVDLAASLTQE